MIREAVLFGGAVYVLIIIAQVIDRPAILAEGAVAAVVLAAATACYLVTDRHRLHVSEMAALWAAVLLFAVYGVLKYGGVI